MNRQGWQMAGTEVLYQPPPVVSTFSGLLLLDIQYQAGFRLQSEQLADCQLKERARHKKVSQKGEQEREKDQTASTARCYPADKYGRPCKHCVNYTTSS